jgi:P2 family phage major capsid protein
MRNTTREKFNGFMSAIAELNGVPSAAVKFAVDPTVQQTLESRITESSEFLKSINVIGVTEQTGQKLGLGVGAPIASTTDTSKNDRITKDPSDLDPNGYLCTQTNFDTHLTYARLDAWAKFDDFQTRVRDGIVQRQALDRICIGFNGVERAADSDRTKNPLLQDVNKGWLQKYREQAAARVLHEGEKTAGKVTVGKGGDYENIDALVYDAISNMIDPWYREDPAIVVMLGRGLLHDKYFPIINGSDTATQKLAADVLVSQKRVGGLKAVSVPYFPANALMIQRLDHLSVYWQEGGRRRTVIDNAKRDRIENFESSNDAYVVEDFGSGCMVENIASVPA